MGRPAEGAIVLHHGDGKASPLAKVPERLHVDADIIGACLEGQMTPAGINAKIDKIEQDKERQQQMR